MGLHFIMAISDEALASEWNLDEMACGRIEERVVFDSWARLIYSRCVRRAFLGSHVLPEIFGEAAGLGVEPERQPF